MSDKRYMPKDASKRAAWLKNFATQLEEHGPALRLGAEEIAAGKADALFAAAALQMQYEAGHYSAAWTKFKDAAMYGDDPIREWPSPFTLPETLPPVTKAGTIRRITKLVSRIKNQPGYNDGIGFRLGIVGTQRTLTPSDMAALQPQIKVRRVSAGHPVIQWRKKGMTGIDIEVDRGDGKGFVYLTFDMHPDHLDMSPLPPPGQAAIWTYRAIYRKGDTRVGQWSNHVQITVTGTI